MKVSKQIPRIFTMAFLLIVFVLPACLDSCKAVPESTNAPVEETFVPPPEKAEAIGEREADGAEEPNYAESRPRLSVRDELVVVFSRGDHLELDFRKSYYAGEAQLFTALYEGLFSYNPVTLEPVLAAARKWETSEDKKQWTFTIRENAKYENGDPVRAGDFRAAWLSLLEPGKDSPYSSLFDIIEGARDFRLGKHESSNVGISAPDEKTLVVRLNSPAAFFPSMLCHHSFSPIHPSLLEEENWARSRPLSNGPYYIDEIDDDHITLVKNENYWDSGRVALNKITVNYSGDGDEASAMWNSGEARWIAGDVNIEALTDRSGIAVNEMFATHYYYIRSGKKPWNDFRVRRALSLVLPWDEIRDGYGLPAKTLIYPFFPGYPEIEGLDTVNAEEARRLLAEAGYPQGVGLPELVIRITSSPEAERIARLMAGAWFETLGIPVKIDVVPFRQYFESLKLDDYDVGSTTWIGDFADPYTFLQMWRKDSNLNDARHNDNDFEALIEKSMTEEGEERWETLAEAEELLLERGNVLPISFSPALNIIDLDEIGGWYRNVLDIHPFKYMTVKARRPLPGVAWVDQSEQMFRQILINRKRVTLSGGPVER